MPLFTFLLEFGGGTYVSQFRSTSIDSAVRKCSAELVENRSLGAPRLREQLSIAIAAEKPIALRGVRRVWCCSASVGNRFALMNIVETSDLSRKKR